MIKIIKADSTQEAYNDIQCGNIPTGSVIVVSSEKVVGIADTWPTAISKEHGDFHTFAQNLSLEEQLDIMNSWGDFDFTESMDLARTELFGKGW